MTKQAVYPSRNRRPAYARQHALYPFAWRTPVLLVPGLNDSGADHWQTRWQQSHRGFVRVEQEDYAKADIDRWAAKVARAVRRSSSAPVVVAHSFGCLATVRAILAQDCVVAGALLVAPADPDRFGVAPITLHGALAVPTTVVASTNDPWLKFVKAGMLATCWNSRLVALEGAGHINAESGHGEWPQGLSLLRDVAERAASAGTINLRTELTRGTATRAA